MAIGVNARTAFSLLYPAILDEFGWDRGATAGIFAFGFIASMFITPFVGILMERFGPNRVIPVGALTVALGLGITPWISSLLAALYKPGRADRWWERLCLVHRSYHLLPNWFMRRRGLVIGLTFSGVGVGGVVLFPLLQDFIGSVGWREACLGLSLLIVATIVPLNWFAQKRRPEDLGLRPDGETEPVHASSSQVRPGLIVDPKWAAIEWTYPKIVTTPRFWALMFAFFFSLFNHYAVQVHQTKYFIELGYGVERSAWALALVVLLSIPGQIFAGFLSDRIGREWAWALAMSGYVVCFILFITMGHSPSLTLMYASVAAVGLVGAGTAPLFGTIGADLFGGPQYGRVFGLLGVACSIGAAAGAWVTGELYDVTGSYELGFTICIGFAAASAVCVAIAGPGRVRPVPGRLPKDS